MCGCGVAGLVRERKFTPKLPETELNPADRNIIPYPLWDAGTPLFEQTPAICIRRKLQSGPGTGD